MNYTKGEWIADEYVAIRVDFDLENCALICGDNSEANAHLIAASPDLYSALKETRYWVSKRHQLVLEMIDNALAKAEGK